MAGEGEAPAFYGYPAPKQGPETAYVKKLASNPVLRGIPLVIAGYLWVAHERCCHHLLMDFEEPHP